MSVFSLQRSHVKMFKNLLSVKRERIAYLLDKDSFANVPGPFFSFEKEGLYGVGRSYLQEAIEVQQIEREELAEISAHDVRRIALFDMRVLNRDRHKGNLLLQNNRLIPLDHAAILPDCWIRGSFCWRSWPQAKSPFSSEEKDYIDSLLLFEEYTWMLDDFQLPLESVQLYFLVGLLLKHLLRKHWTAFEISNLFVSNRLRPSKIAELANHCTAIKELTKIEEYVKNIF